jgi:hypothetical protein
MHRVKQALDIDSLAIILFLIFLNTTTEMTNKKNGTLHNNFFEKMTNFTSKI